MNSEVRDMRNIPLPCYQCKELCRNVGKLNRFGEAKAFCAFCLPPQYMHKSQDEWICDLCKERRLGKCVITK